MMPKEFIQRTLIDEMKDIVFRHPFLSFALLSMGIEFLGKCMLTEYKDWELPKKERWKAFCEGMKLLCAVDERYNCVDLKGQLRNGFIHTLKPGGKISVSEVKAGDKMFDIDKKTKTIIVAEILYRDFVIACKKIIATDFSADDKMNCGFLDIYESH